MDSKTGEYIQRLQGHPDSIIRWKTGQQLLNRQSVPDIAKARNDLANSPTIQRLLSDQKEDGRIHFGAYDKWFGAHWVLSLLADLGYPAGDERLKPLLEQCYGWLLSNEHVRNIRMIDGRIRRCASQEGNCIYYSLALGIADDRTAELADRLVRWQWEDGGWNCDKHPEAINSSFNETLIPLRGLAWFVRHSGDPKARQAVEGAAEVFLKRQLLYRLRDGQLMDKHFIRLHYPNYWHYDYLFALKVLMEAGYVDDAGCQKALDLLQGRQLPDGGFPAEEKYYRVDDNLKLSGHSRVDFGGTSKVHANPFVSLDALIVLKHAGRLRV